MTSGSQSTRYMACSTLYLECILYAGWHCSCRYSNLVSRSFPVVLSSSPDNPDNRRDSYLLLLRGWTSVACTDPPLTQYFGGKNCNWCLSSIRDIFIFASSQSQQHNNPNLFEDNLRYRNSIVIFIYRTKSSYVEQPLLLL